MLRVLIMGRLFFIGFLFLPAFAQAEDFSRGEAMIENYFRKQAASISQSCLVKYRTKDEWEKARPELRRQFFDMMGLWPLPARTELKATITGRVEAAKFTVEKLHFQSWPNLYVTANLYLPKPLPKGKLPAVLYVCGHGNIVKKIDGKNVSFGSKAYSQQHPAWFAEHGYACLILDTLELGEIPGEHHGTYSRGMWWWQTLGYTPAGIECWNGMRALDYLESRPEIDAKRIGVTGRSGGGATSWWIAAADDRVQCIVPVAGIADLQAHLNEGYPGRLEKGIIAGHCDCMFNVNTYRWDFPMVAALCAPRPLLLGNSDKDDIFPVPAYRRLAAKVRPIYDLYGADDKFDLLETRGPHTDTPELRIGAYQWMNRWLKNDTAPATEDKFEPLPVEQLKVLSKIPEGAVNETIHDFFIKPAHLELPLADAVACEWWKGERPILEKALREAVFRGWPEKAPPLNIQSATDQVYRGVRLQSWDFTSEDGIELRLWLWCSAEIEKPTYVVLDVLAEITWKELCVDLGPEFDEALFRKRPEKPFDINFGRTFLVMKDRPWAYAAICPRGIGPTKWAEPGSSADIQIRRRFPLIGQTLDGQRVWDVRRALAVLRENSDLKDVPFRIQAGEAETAAIALYAGILEPDVTQIDLWNLSPTHKQGPIFLNVRKYLDVPQAVALAFPKSVCLHVENAADAKAWNWPLCLQDALGKKSLKLLVIGSEGDTR